MFSKRRRSCATFAFARSVAHEAINVVGEMLGRWPYRSSRSRCVVWRPSECRGERTRWDGRRRIGGAEGTRAHVSQGRLGVREVTWAAYAVSRLEGEMDGNGRTRLAHILMQ